MTDDIDREAKEEAERMLPRHTLAQAAENGALFSWIDGRQAAVAARIDALLRERNAWEARENATAHQVSRAQEKIAELKRALALNAETFERFARMEHELSFSTRDVARIAAEHNRRVLAGKGYSDAK